MAKKIQIAGELKVACDNELSLNSEKPVQNKVVTEALDKKQDNLTFATNTDIYKLFT